MMKRRPHVQVIRPTVLVVGEGYAEFNFLQHVRGLYTSNRVGHQLKAQNARGKGARHVIGHAIRLMKRADYDVVAALFDTDKDWNDEVLANAERHGLILLKSEPCFEAVLLAAVGRSASGNTQQHKRRFIEHFGCEASAPGLFDRHFPREVLDAARSRVNVVDALLTLLNI